MKKTLFTILAAVLLLIPSAASGQTAAYEDMGSWLSAQAMTSWGKAYGTVRAELRTNDKMSSRECWFALVAGGYKFTDWFSADLGYEMWNINQAINHRFVLTTSETLRQGNLSATLREKYEYTVTPAGTTYSNLRVRLKTQYSIPDSCFKPYIAGEVFAWDGWKRSLNYVGTEISIGSRSTLDLFYLYHVQKGGPTFHTLGVGYIISL